MVEAKKWMVNPLKSKLAHFTTGLNIPDPDGQSQSGCGKHTIDSTWSPWEGHKEKCKTCLDIMETKYLDGIARVEEMNRRRIERRLKE